MNAPISSGGDQGAILRNLREGNATVTPLGKNQSKFEVKVDGNDGRTYKILVRNIFKEDPPATLAAKKTDILTVASGLLYMQGISTAAELVEKKPLTTRVVEGALGQMTLEKAKSQSRILIDPEKGDAGRTESVKVHVGNSLKNFLCRALGMRAKTKIGGETMTIDLTSLYKRLNVTEKAEKNIIEKQLKTLKNMSDKDPSRPTHEQTLMTLLI